MEPYSALSKRFHDLCLEREFDFRRHTTIGCGGVANVCAYPSSEAEAAALLGFLKREEMRCFLMGAGANVLAGEGSFGGAVVRLSRLNRLVLLKNGRIYAGAGVTGGRLCRFAREKGISGFEPFTGIPMTVGGGIAMNAGVREGHFSDVVEEVFAIDEEGLVRVPLSMCGFSEKRSVFQSGIAVVGAILCGKKADSDEIQKNTFYFREKRKHLPKGRSMGCCFVNPKEKPAGQIIEECGLKGASVGGAKVSELHANFILNEGGSADDVKKLLSLVKETVLKRTGICLQEEIRRFEWNT